MFHSKSLGEADDLMEQILAFRFYLKEMKLKIDSKIYINFQKFSISVNMILQIPAKSFMGFQALRENLMSIGFFRLSSVFSSISPPLGKKIGFGIE